MPTSPNRKVTPEKAMVRVLALHGNKYTYPDFTFIKTTEIIDIICPIPEHGLFRIPLSDHLHVNKRTGVARGCPKCGISLRNIKKTATKEEVLIKCKLVRGDDFYKYDYSLIEFKNYKTKVKIRCKEHDFIFEQNLDSHINKKADCPICATESAASKRRGTLEDFISDGETEHGVGTYGYEKYVYISYDTPGIIICLKGGHGEFLQDPEHHTRRGQGCPVCSESHGERRIRLFLESNDIKFEPQKRFDECRNINSLPFDFYIPKYKLCIEFDGIQHYKPMERIANKIFTAEESKINFNRIKEHDKIKTKYCNKVGLDLIRIKHTKMNKIDKILSDFIFP